MLCPTFRVSKTRNIARYGLQWLRYYLNSLFFFSISVLPSLSYAAYIPLSPIFLWSWRMVDRQKRRRQKHFEILKMPRKHAGQIFGTYRAAWVGLRQYRPRILKLVQSMLSKLGFALTLDTSHYVRENFPIVSVVLCKEYIRVYRTYRWKNFSVEGAGIVYWKHED